MCRWERSTPYSAERLLLGLRTLHIMLCWPQSACFDTCVCRAMPTARSVLSGANPLWTSAEGLLSQFHGGPDTWRQSLPPGTARTQQQPSSYSAQEAPNLQGPGPGGCACSPSCSAGIATALHALHLILTQPRSTSMECTPNSHLPIVWVL